MNNQQKVDSCEKPNQEPMNQELGLDDMVRKFKGYCNGENGFDELDFKEAILDWIEKDVIRDFITYAVGERCDTLTPKEECRSCVLWDDFDNYCEQRKRLRGEK
jgi:hypothetical protein